MKKKLLFINGHLDTGGVEKSLLDILAHLDYEKYDADLLLTEHPGDYADQLPPQVRVLLRSIEDTYGPLAKVILTSIRKRDWFSLKMRLVFLAAKLFGRNGSHYPKRCGPAGHATTASLASAWGSVRSLCGRRRLADHLVAPW